MTPKKPTLLLLPNVLGEEAAHELFLPASVDRAVQTLDGLIAESPKGGRTFLRRFSFPPPKTFADIPIELLNEHTPEDQIDPLLQPILRGERWGLVSDAGLPCLADPGAKCVYRARELGIAIEAFVGPSAMTLALMLSGLSGQAFTFHGYLEREPSLRVKEIQALQVASLKKGSTQIFIEAPYRTPKMLETLLKTLSDATLLCVAWDLTLPTQGVICQPIRLWKKKALPLLDKKPAVFLVNARP